MATLTKTEVTSELANLHIAKQELAALDDDLNTQAATIMDKARSDVQAIRDAQQVDRAAALDAIDKAELRLKRGK